MVNNQERKPMEAKEYLKKQGITDRITNSEDLPEYWKTISRLMEDFAEPIQEELSISNTQREGYKEQLEEQRKLVLDLQEKNRELKSEIAVLLAQNQHKFDKIKEQAEEIERKALQRELRLIEDISKEYGSFREQFIKFKMMEIRNKLNNI